LADLVELLGNEPLVALQKRQTVLFQVVKGIKAYRILVIGAVRLQAKAAKRLEAIARSQAEVAIPLRGVN